MLLQIARVTSGEILDVYGISSGMKDKLVFCFKLPVEFAHLQSPGFCRRCHTFLSYLPSIPNC
jgi:hypothetical protein